MSEPIKVGDLVMTVRGHECLLKAVGGMPFIVDLVHPTPTGCGSKWRCGRCSAKRLFPIGPYVKHNGASIPLPWLIRVDPPKEKQDERHDEEITA